MMDLASAEASVTANSTTVLPVHLPSSAAHAKAIVPPGVSVVAVIDTAILSGPGRQLVAQGVAQQARGVPFSILTFQRAGRDVSPFVRYAQARGLACDVIEETGRLDLTVLTRMRDALARRGATVIQTHGYRPSALVRTLRALGWTTAAWVGFYHGATAEDWKVRLYDALDRRLLRSADQVVVMSRPQMALFEGLHDRLSLVFNAVLEADATTDALRRTTLPPAVPGRARVAVIGRLSPEKGVDVLLAAAAILRDERHAIDWLVAGDGPERAALERQCAALSLDDAVHFLGQVQDVSALYRAIDLLVIPSRSEGLPNVLLEALRHGCFAVSTRVGAVPDVLDGTRAGIVVPPEAPRALADAIVRGLAERGDAEVARDRAEVIERFSLDARVRALEAIQGRAIVARGAAPATRRA